MWPSVHPDAKMIKNDASKLPKWCQNDVKSQCLHFLRWQRKLFSIFHWSVHPGAFLLCHDAKMTPKGCKKWCRNDVKMILKRNQQWCQNDAKSQCLHFQRPFQQSMWPGGVRVARFNNLKQRRKSRFKAMAQKKSKHIRTNRPGIAFLRDMVVFLHPFALKCWPRQSDEA